MAIDSASSIDVLYLPSGRVSDIECSIINSLRLKDSLQRQKVGLLHFSKNRYP